MSRWFDTRDGVTTTEHKEVGVMYGGSGWAMAAMSLVWLAVLGLVVWLTATALQPRTTSTPAPDAGWILQDRLARGEIDRDEYRDRLAALDGR